MNGIRLLGAALMMSVAALSPAPALAERLAENSAKAKKTMEACMDAGSAQVESEGVTSCIYNGHGIICGGPKPEHKGTCDTFRQNPKFPKRRSEAQLARLSKMTKSPGR